MPLQSGSACVQTPGAGWDRMSRHGSSTDQRVRCSSPDMAHSQPNFSLHCMRLRDASASESDCESGDSALPLCQLKKPANRNLPIAVAAAPGDSVRRTLIHGSAHNCLNPWFSRFGSRSSRGDHVQPVDTTLVRQHQHCDLLAFLARNMHHGLAQGSHISVAKGSSQFPSHGAPPAFHSIAT
jgi:hypothetical protein